MFSKLFRKLTTRVKYTRFWNAKLKSIRLVFHRIEIEPFRLDFDTHNKNENNEREALPKRKEKQSNNLLLKQSNTTAKEKQQHQQTQDPPGVLHGSNRTSFARVVGIRSELLELIGWNQWFSLTLSCSISLVPN